MNFSLNFLKAMNSDNKKHPINNHPLNDGRYSRTEKSKDWTVIQGEGIRKRGEKLFCLIRGK